MELWPTPAALVLSWLLPHGDGVVKLGMTAGMVGCASVAVWAASRLWRARTGVAVPFGYAAAGGAVLCAGVWLLTG